MTVTSYHSGDLALKPIDIIIVNYNSTQHAIELIKSIEHVAKYPLTNFFIIDNASMDTPELFHQYFQDIVLLLNKSNIGFSRAVNQAVKISHSPYILLINPDTIISNDFLNECVEFMEQNQTIGVIGPKIFDPDGGIQGSARTFPNFWTSIFGRKSPLTKMFPTNPFTKRQFPCLQSNGDKPVEVDWVSGACMLIRREALQKVNGFDESFFLYWEDTDFCTRIRHIGYKIVYYPRAEITHAVGASSSTRPIKSIFHFHHSSFKLFRKFCSNLQLIFLPIILSGLFLRCFFVISINYFFKSFLNIQRNFK